MKNSLEYKLRNITFEKFYKKQNKEFPHRDKYFNSINLTNRYIRLYKKYFIKDIKLDY